MANAQDKQNYQDVERANDAAALTLNDLAAELLQLETKYGTGSSILKKKRDQFNTLRAQYDQTLKYINYLRDLNDRMAQEVTSRELSRHKRETGLPYEMIAELAGWPPGAWAKLDKIDQVLQEAGKSLGIREDESFESFIYTLRGEK